MSDEKSCPRCAETVKAAAVVCKHCGHNFQTGENPDTKVFPVPPKKSFSFGKGCLIALVVLVGLVVVGMIVGGDEDASKPSASNGEAKAAVEPIDVTARQLEAAYEANEAAAQQQYGNAPLLVSATIQSIDLGLTDEPFLVLSASNPFIGPQAQLTEASQAKVPFLSKGQNVTLLCQSVSELAGTPMLKDCEIQ